MRVNYYFQGKCVRTHLSGDFIPRQGEWVTLSIDGNPVTLLVDGVSWIPEQATVELSLTEVRRQ